MEIIRHKFMKSKTPSLNIHLKVTNLPFYTYKCRVCWNLDATGGYTGGLSTRPKGGLARRIGGNHEDCLEGEVATCATATYR